MTLLRLIKSIEKKEWQFIFILSAILILGTTMPLIIGWLMRPKESVFTGVHLGILTDWFVYYSYLEQVRQGHWFFYDLFTFEKHLPVFNLFWLSVGLFSKWFSLSNLVAFNLVRIILIPIFLIVAYLFSVLIFEKTFYRKMSLIFLSTSSGFGFLAIGQIIKFPGNFENGKFNWPMDLWVPEFNTFATLYYSPHLIASLILIVSIFLLTVIFSENLKIFYGLAAGFLSFLLISFHPFHALTVFGVVLAYLGLLIVNKRKIVWQYLAYFFVLGLISLPAIYYYAFLLKNDYVTRIKYIQNLCLSTPIWLTIISLGGLVFFAAYSFLPIIRNKVKNGGISSPKGFLVVWFIVQFSMLYAPVLFQRRLSEGLHFPLVFLALLGWEYYREKNPKRVFDFFGKSVLVLTIITLSLSNLFLISADLYIYISRKPFVYLSRGYMSSLLFLKSQASDGVVLNTAQEVVNVIPAYAGRPVYVGHGIETLSFFTKQKEVVWFFSKNREEDLEVEFLKKREIKYIFYTDNERSLGEYYPQSKKYLYLIFENPEVKIYKVR